MNKLSAQISGKQYSDDERVSVAVFAILLFILFLTTRPAVAASAESFDDCHPRQPAAVYRYTRHAMHTDIRDCPQVLALTDVPFSFRHTVCLNSRIPNHGGKCTCFLQIIRAAAGRRRAAGFSYPSRTAASRSPGHTLSRYCHALPAHVRSPPPRRRGSSSRRRSACR